MSLHTTSSELLCDSPVFGSQYFFFRGPASTQHASHQPRPPYQPTPLTWAHSFSSPAKAEYKSSCCTPSLNQIVHCSHARSSSGFLTDHPVPTNTDPILRGFPWSSDLPVSALGSPPSRFRPRLSLASFFPPQLLAPLCWFLQIPLHQTLLLTSDPVPSPSSPADCSKKGRVKLYRTVCAAFGFTPQPFHTWPTQQRLIWVVG